MSVAVSQEHVKRLVLMSFLMFGVFLVFLMNVSLGSVDISLKDIISVFKDTAIADDYKYSIIMEMRVPRTLAALIGGACIALSGLFLQIFFSNPIVEPYVLGISSGATLFVAFVTMGGGVLGITSNNPLMLFAGSFMGALIVLCLLILVSSRIKGVTTLLIIGIMIGFICSSVKSVLMAFAEREVTGSFVIWMLGSFSGFSWLHLKYLIVLTIPFILISFFILKPLNALLLGENYASSMGLDTRKFRIIILVISGVLTAAVTAFAGPVSFIGLAVPHIIRVMMATSDNRYLVPSVLLAGALMTGLCDLVSRLIVSPMELPLGAVTPVIGAPVVIYLLIKKEGQIC